MPCPTGLAAYKQSVWDKLVPASDRLELMDSLSKTEDQARLLEVTSAHNGEWLHALPLSGCRLRLDDHTTHTAVGLRLGDNICQPRECPCCRVKTAGQRDTTALINTYGVPTSRQSKLRQVYWEPTQMTRLHHTYTMYTTEGWKCVNVEGHTWKCHHSCELPYIQTNIQAIKQKWHYRPTLSRIINERLITDADHSYWSPWVRQTSRSYWTRCRNKLTFFWPWDGRQGTCCLSSFLECRRAMRASSSCTLSGTRIFSTWAPWQTTHHVSFTCMCDKCRTVKISLGVYR